MMYVVYIAMVIGGEWANFIFITFLRDLYFFRIFFNFCTHVELFKLKIKTYRYPLTFIMDLKNKRKFSMKKYTKNKQKYIVLIIVF